MQSEELPDSKVLDQCCTHLWSNLSIVLGLTSESVILCNEVIVINQSEPAYPLGIMNILALFILILKGCQKDNLRGTLWLWLPGNVPTIVCHGLP